MWIYGRVRGQECKLGGCRLRFQCEEGGGWKRRVRECGVSEGWVWVRRVRIRVSVW